MTTKAELRGRVVAARAALGTAAVQRAGAAIAAHVLTAVAGVPTLAAYVPVGPEPGTVGLLDALRERGSTVLLPVVVGDGLDWAPYEGVLVDGPFGLMEPAATRLGAGALREADVVIVPALAVDRAGHRLGRGRGYYDRALTSVAAATPVVALLHDGEFVDTVPADPHDRRVTGVVTPTGGWVDL